MNIDPPIRVSASDRRMRSRRERKQFLSASVIAAFVLGIVFVGVFNVAMDWTNREEFCISCHEMKNTVYREYVDNSHNINRTGVRATCADCHVPKPFFAKIFRKLQASGELWHSIQGSIDTPEKFEQRRALLAMRVWKHFKANDSQQCRNCHTPESFDLSAQGRRAATQHEEELLTKKQTCIDCHKGVVHEMPKGLNLVEVNRILAGGKASAPTANQAPPQADSPATDPGQTDSPSTDSTDQKANQTDSPNAAPE